MRSGQYRRTGFYVQEPVREQSLLGHGAKAPPIDLEAASAVGSWGMTHPNAPNTSPEHLLADIIAGHFLNAGVEDREDAQTVVLGDGLPTTTTVLRICQDRISG